MEPISASSEDKAGHAVVRTHDTPRSPEDEMEDRDLQDKNEVIKHLSHALGVSEQTLVDTLARLVRGNQRRDGGEELARRAGLRLLNAGDTLLVRESDIKEQQLADGHDTYIVPTQFSVTEAVPNAPYQAMGLIPNAFLHISLHTEGRSTVTIDWTLIYRHSGLWGNMRLVVRRTDNDRSTVIEPARQLQWEVTLEGKQSIELFGVGTGVDVFGVLATDPRKPMAPAVERGGREPR